MPKSRAALTGSDVFQDGDGDGFGVGGATHQQGDQAE
jgi:hypothetical protein